EPRLRTQLRPARRAARLRELDEPGLLLRLRQRRGPGPVHAVPDRARPREVRRSAEEGRAHRVRGQCRRLAVQRSDADRAGTRRLRIPEGLDQLAQRSRGRHQDRRLTMIRYTLTRGALLIAGLLVSSVIIFLTLRVFPGDVAQLIAGTQASPETVAALRESLGLNKPLSAQYTAWIGGILHGDLGTSQLSGASVGAELAEKARVTVPLGIMALTIALLIAVPFGILSAVLRGRSAGTSVNVAAQAVAAVPVIWAGMMLVVVFALWL